MHFWREEDGMRKFWILGFAIVALALSAAAQQANVAARLGYPQMILTNAKVVTMDDASFEARVGTIVEAMAIRDGKVLATGTSADMRMLAGPQTKVIDLKGRTVLPAFIHTHEHPTDWMWTEPEALKYALPENDFIMVRWMTGTAEEQWANWEVTLRDMQAKAKPGQWLWLSFSWGPDFENVEGLFDAFPKIVTPQKLDELAPRNPARVRNAWPLVPQVQVNTKGLEEVRKVYDWAGLRKSGSEASDPLGRQTEPDVIFQGRTEALAKILKAEMELWAAHGVTTFGSAPYSYHNLQALNFLDQRGEMPGRFAWGYIGPDFSMDTLRQIAGILGNGTDYLWNVGAWGNPGGTCTTLRAPADVKAKEFCALTPGSPGAEMLTNIIKAGGRVATMHSGGDQDIDYFLDAIVKASREAGMTIEQIREKRHAFDHASGAPRPDQIPILKNLGMMVSMINTVLWENRRDYDISFRVRNYGIEYAHWAVPRKSVTAAGIMNGFEIDRALPHKLWYFIYTGMTRFNDKDQKVYGPSERTDRITQLKSLTRWGAYYLLREKTLGTLETGKLADFIVLDRDFLTIPENDIPNVRVLMTAVGGKVIHLMPALATEIGMQPAGPVTWPTKPLEGYYKR
jgi:predicted amidohydrolase YtcJ